MDPKNILITGASGLIGTRLTEKLQARGHVVKHLSRTESNGPVKTFVWDIKKSLFPPAALEGTDTIVHLAGAGIADKRWTSKRKKILIESRVESANLLYNKLQELPHSVKSFVSASAMGYYGLQTDDHVLTEDSPAGKDFLADITVPWEKAADQMSDLGLRVVKLRIGVVLSHRGGALESLAKPIKWFVGAPLGTGNQLMSWIHVDDLCNAFIKAIEEQSLSGAYNAIAPEVVTNRQFTKQVARILHKPLLLPPIPGFVMDVLLGKMSEMLLKGANLSCGRLLNTGYDFKFATLEPALYDLLLKTKIAQ